MNRTAIIVAALIGFFGGVGGYVAGVGTAMLVDNVSCQDQTDVGSVAYKTRHPPATKNAFGGLKIDIHGKAW